ncbi:MAG: tRNA 4-thiouridine(8) synthase ThiI [Candidatus Latescibacteria bacterium]|nr:tRNA 4-thiouridine(8) synthase ThiI [Candidatus Latescibacterota bacterium]
MVKAIGLVSGGLDSILAVKIILEQNILVIGVSFISPFFDNSQFIKKLCKELKIESVIIEFGKEYIGMLKNPKYGYGKNLNPCIDCHTYMLKQAKILMQERDADFIFTGEVLNERPMSQNRQALVNIERESGLKGYLLRPLSAQLLEPTIAENKGLIDRNRLGKISGRSRKPQYELAQKYGITDIPQPASGCLLTEPNFNRRLKDALNHNEDAVAELHLLKIGRHFRTEQGAKIIVGRNESENNELVKLTHPNDLILEPLEIPGPVVLIHNSKNHEQVTKIAAGLCARYSDKSESALVKVKVNSIIIETKSLSEELLNKMRI